MKIYISGPISNLTQAEYEENFSRAAALIMSEGHEPVNPVQVTACADESCAGTISQKADGSYLHTWQCYMKHDLMLLLECEGIAMLSGWPASKGACLEHHVAVSLDMPVFLIRRGYTELQRVVNPNQF